MHDISLAIVHEYLHKHRVDVVSKLEGIVPDLDRRDELSTNLEEALEGLGEPIPINEEEY